MATLTETRTFYIGAFFAIFVSLYALYSASDALVTAYYEGLASSVCWLFNWFDQSVGCDANYILYNDIRELVVVEGCDGITFVALIVAAVLPFPSRWQTKVIGLVWLVPVLLLANWVRLVLLTAVRFYAPLGFDFFHVYFFQPLMIAFTLIMFLMWIGPNYAAPKEV